jgi:hypothetical protein
VTREGQVSDKVCLVTGYERKQTARCLNGPPLESQPPATSASSRPVDQELCLAWEAADYPPVRLKALLPRWLPRLKKLPISPRPESQLLRIGPRQTYRRLKPYKMRAKKRLYGMTKPGTLLKHQIPINAERWQVDQLVTEHPNPASEEQLKSGHFR